MVCYAIRYGDAAQEFKIHAHDYAEDPKNANCQLPLAVGQTCVFMFVFTQQSEVALISSRGGCSHERPQAWSRSADSG